jgi:hypothetical protein
MSACELKSPNIRDRVHERHVDLDSLGNQVLDFTKHGQVVLGLDVFGVGGVEARNEASQGRNSDTLTNAENRCC